MEEQSSCFTCSKTPRFLDIPRLFRLDISCCCTSAMLYLSEGGAFVSSLWRVLWIIISLAYYSPYEQIPIEKHVPIAQAQAKFFSSTIGLIRRDLVFNRVGVSNLPRLMEDQTVCYRNSVSPSIERMEGSCRSLSKPIASFSAQSPLLEQNSPQQKPITSSVNFR